MRSKKRKWVLWFVGLSVVGAVVYVATGPHIRHSTAYPIRAPESWFDSCALLIRRDGPFILLRTLTRRECQQSSYVSPPSAEQSGLPILRYERGVSNLAIVSGREWDEAMGPVMECSDQERIDESVLTRKDHGLFLNGLLLTTVGRVLAGVAVLRGDSSYPPYLGHHLAVLSTTGSVHKPLIPFLGSGYVTGVRYHEVFRLSDGAPIGDPVLLKGVDSSTLVRPCWAPDEEFVIYYSAYFSKELWLIPFPPESRVERSR